MRAWIAECLAMGHPTRVGNLIRETTSNMRAVAQKDGPMAKN